RPLPHGRRHPVHDRHFWHFPQPQERDHHSDVDRADPARRQPQPRRLLGLPRRSGRPSLRTVGAHRGGGGSGYWACHSGRLLPQSRLDRGRGHQLDEGLRAACITPSFSCRSSARSSRRSSRSPARVRAIRGGPPAAVDASHAPGAPSAPGAHADLDVLPSEQQPQPAAGSRSAELVTTVFLFASMLLSWLAFVDVGFGHHDSRVALFPWIISGDVKVDWALRIDALTAVVLVVVTTISAFVHLYSIGYMEEDPFRPRFLSFLSLFTFAMLTLVTADNLVQLFFGWEGVGLMSYLLIGFWYHKPEANAAAIKAFIVNRVGDFGFSLGIFTAFVMTGALD